MCLNVCNIAAIQKSYGVLLVLVYLGIEIMVTVKKIQRNTAGNGNSRINDLNLWLTFNTAEIRCDLWRDKAG